MSIKAKAIKDFIWVTLGKNLATIIRFIGGIYLARKIDPVFFGEQGLAFSIVLIIWSFIILGDDPALIKQQKDIDAYMRALMFVKMSILSLLFIVIMFLYITGLLPGTREIKFYTILIFLSQIPSQITSLYLAYMAKNMYFKRLAFMEITAVFVSVSLACVLAYFGSTIWALIWLLMAERLSMAVLTIICAPKMVMPKFNKGLIIEFFHYSKYVTLTSILDRVGTKINDIFIGSYISLSSLGFYQRAIGLGGYMQTGLINGMADITQPHFSRVQGDREKLGRYFEFTSSLYNRVLIGAFIAVAIIFPSIVRLIYGEKWLPTVPIFLMLLPYLILQCFRTILRNTHQIAGSIRLLTFAQSIEVGSLFLILYPLLLWKGVYGVIFAANITIIISVGIMLVSFKKYADFEINKIFVNPFISSSIVLFLFFYFNLIDINSANIIKSLSIAMAFFISYLILLCLMEMQYLIRLYKFFRP
jgi:O-antigen/teichoic acid export membrane protein